MSGTDIEIIVEFEDVQVAKKLFHYAKKYLKKDVPFSSFDQAIRLLAGDTKATAPVYLPNPLEHESRAALVPQYGDIDYPMDKEDFSEEKPDELRFNLDDVAVDQFGIVSIKFFTAKHFLSHDLVDIVLSWFDFSEIRFSEVSVINDFDGNMKRYRADQEGRWECKGDAWNEEALAWKTCF